VISEDLRLTSPVRPTLAPVAAFAVMAGLILIGWAIGELIAGPLDSSVGALDEEVVSWVDSWRTPWLTAFVDKAQLFGSTAWLVVSLSLVVVAAVVWLGSKRWVPFATGCMLGGVISTIVKVLVDRPRPADDALVHLSEAAFPSGHALTSALTFGAIAIFLVHGARLPRGPIWIGAGLCAGVVGFTRIYLGVHWPTDVVGGWLIGAAWVAAVVLIVRPERRDQLV
jgi:membrane-associated phospholipid phosphatase